MGKNIQLLNYLETSSSPVPSNVKYTRKYQALWVALKRADLKTGVTVRCWKDTAATVIKGLRNEKSRECSVKKGLGMLRPGDLAVSIVEDKENPGYQLITFTLTEDFSRL